jgi:hypothetical protein
MSARGVVARAGRCGRRSPGAHHRRRRQRDEDGRHDQPRDTRGGEHCAGGVRRRLCGHLADAADTDLDRRGVRRATPTQLHRSRRGAKRTTSNISTTGRSGAEMAVPRVRNSLPASVPTPPNWAGRSAAIAMIDRSEHVEREQDQRVSLQSDGCGGIGQGGHQRLLVAQGSHHHTFLRRGPGNAEVHPPVRPCSPGYWARISARLRANGGRVERQRRPRQFRIRSARSLMSGQSRLRSTATGHDREAGLLPNRARPPVSRRMVRLMAVTSSSLGSEEEDERHQH